MSVDQTAVMYLSAYGPVAIFLGAFFFGESVIIAAAFLASQGLWSVWELFLLAFLGTVISDAVWFSGGFGLNKLISKGANNQSRLEKVVSSIQKITKGKSFLSLLFIKFLYGTRIITIFYLGSQKLPFRKFLIFNSLGTIIWLIVVVFIGWSLGQGTKFLSVDLNHIEIILSVLILVIIFFKFFSKWITKQIIQK